MLDPPLGLLGLLMHGVLPVVVIPELLGVGQDAEEDPAHPADPEVLRGDARRVLGLYLSGDSSDDDEWTNT